MELNKSIQITNEEESVKFIILLDDSNSIKLFKGIKERPVFLLEIGDDLWDNEEWITGAYDYICNKTEENKKCYIDLKKYLKEYTDLQYSKKEWKLFFKKCFKTIEKLQKN